MPLHAPDVVSDVLTDQQCAVQLAGAHGPTHIGSADCGAYNSLQGRVVLSEVFQKNVPRPQIQGIVPQNVRRVSSGDVFADQSIAIQFIDAHSCAQCTYSSANVCPM